VRPLAVLAATNMSVRAGVDPPVFVCPPCRSSHGDWFPGPVYTMHERVQLTPFELELARRLAAAVRRGRCSVERIARAISKDEDLEDLAVLAETIRVLVVGET
jgi:hypothetical protein